MMKSIFLTIAFCSIISAQLDMTSDNKMDFEDNIAEESSQSNERVFTDILAPKPILNDGKPFYVARDPATGTLDFNVKKTVGIQNDIPVSRKDELVSPSKGHDINSIGHTFHDYLNIPVKYSSSKFVYPLISSSYANMKYQGNNKNQNSNHKNYTTTLGTTTMSPKYFTHIITSKAFTETTTSSPITTNFFKTVAVTTYQPPRDVIKITNKPVTAVKEGISAKDAIAALRETIAAKKEAHLASKESSQSSSVSKESSQSNSASKEGSLNVKDGNSASKEGIKGTKEQYAVNKQQIKDSAVEKDSTEVIKGSPTYTSSNEPNFPSRESNTHQKDLIFHSTTTKPSESPSTVKYSSTIIQSNQFPSTFKKYVDSSETRKKITTQISTTERPTTLPSNPVKFLDDLLETVERKETKATTFRPQIDRLSFATSMPLRPSGFKPMPTEAPTRNESKITFESAANPAVMTLSEIFNSISGNEEKNEILYETADSSQIEVKRPLPISSAMPIDATTLRTTTSQQKTLQQQMREPNKPQYVDLPVHQPPNFPPQSSFAPQHPPQFGNSHVGFPDDQFEDYVEFENPGDQYVRYEVQKPNVNHVKFQQMPIPNMNNVVISPGQNSASFVLGSQQNVGSVGVGSSMGVGTSHFADSNGPVKMGQVINDDPPNRPPTATINNQIQTSIRFPSDAESAFDNAPIIKGTFKMNGNGESVQPPQALAGTTTPKSPLIFPASHDQHVMHAELAVGMTAPSPQPSNPSQIIFENVNDIYEKVNDKKQKLEVNDLSSNDLSPPMILTPPSHIQKNQFNRQPMPQYPPNRRLQKPNILPQFRPNSRISQGHPQMHREVGSIRVPPNFRPQQALPKVGLPPMNPNLRRIPPQNGFNTRPQRPQPYPQGNFNQIPNLHQNINDMPHLRQNPNNLPNLRQNPNHHPFSNEQNIDSGNRRVFQVAPQSPQHFPLTDRYMRPPPVQQPPLYYLNRPLNAVVPPETMQMQQRPSIVPYNDIELNKSLPPTPNLQPNLTFEDVNGKLEPVVTLQMLQTKKNGGNRLNHLPSIPHEIPQDLSATPLPKNHKLDDVNVPKEPSVYVVYPVQANSQQSLDEQREDEHLIVANKNEYQNTPFAVVTHFEQEPLLMKKDKRRPNFPYQIEKPAQPNIEVRNDNFPSKFGAQQGSIYNIGEEPHDAVITGKYPHELNQFSHEKFPHDANKFLNPHDANKFPYELNNFPHDAHFPTKFPHDLNKFDAAISSKLTRVTEKPIAIAYTPTEPSRISPPMSFYQHIQPQNPYGNFGNKFSHPNFASPVISEIHDEKQFSHDYYHRHAEDSSEYHRKEHYDFEAPFQASVSLNPEVTNPYEGWTVVTKSTEENKIDRSDLNVIESSEELTTKKFDANEFQPIFESGFQPIYSSNRVSTAPEFKNINTSEHPSTLSLSVVRSTTETSHSIESSSSSLEEVKSSEIASTTAKSEKKKEKIEIDSLEAFFESLTRDYDDDEESTQNKSENESRSL